MKTVAKLTSIFLLAFTVVACAQDKKNTVTEKAIPNKETSLSMDKKDLDAKVIKEIEKEIIKRKVEITAKTLTTISQTQDLIVEIDKGNTKKAIKKGKELIGDLEVLLAKDPSLALIPINVTYQKEEFVADIKTVRDAVKLVKKAIKKGHYRVASDILKDLRSEMVISTYLLPAATYPEAIKAAVVLLEDGKKEEAKLALIAVLNTLVIETEVVPLPVLNAEQMVIEAALIDAKDHTKVDDVINLLNNADYQLQLAEELGYGKKDKEYGALADVIKELKKSVKAKKDSKSKFDALKEKIRTFKERLFTNKKK